jgi:colanic acid/amylovoran biosynthesis protein
MLNVVIINQPLRNRGDEAAHRSLMRTLINYFPNTYFSVLFSCEDPYAINEFIVKSDRISYKNISCSSYNDIVKRWSLRIGCIFLSQLHPTIREYARIIKKSDLVICAPGGICMGSFQNWNHIFNLSLAKYFRKPLVYYSRSFGPFPIKTKWNRVFQKISYKLLDNFDFLSIRDKKTMTLADQLGVSYLPSIDTAFLDNPNAEIPPEILQTIGCNKFVVFVPNSLTWHPTYKTINQLKIDSFYLKVLNFLSKSYPQVIMLPQLSLTSNSDYQYFKNLLSKTNLSNVSIIKDIYSSDIQQKIISMAKCVVGARYHSIVFAINNSVPFVSLSYEHKMTGLLNLFDLEVREIILSGIGTENFNEENKLNELKNILETPYSNAREIQAKAHQIAVSTFVELKNKFS